MKVIKPLFIIMCFLVSLSFFDLIFIPPEIIPRLQLAIAPLILLFLIVLLVYQKGEVIKSNFKFELYMLLFGVLLSVFGAYFFHDQGFIITIIAQRTVYLYFFYFLLLKLKPKPDLLVKTFVYISLFVAFLYIIQTIAFPAELVRSQMWMDRGTVRIFLPGIGYCVISYFYFFNQYLKHLRLRDLFISLIMLIIFILLGTRQIIAPVMLITILNVILSKRIKSKIVVTLIGTLAIIPIFILSQNIMSQMLEVSKSQGEDFESNIRVRAIKFFLTDFFPNTISYITGNGVQGGDTEYGEQVGVYMKKYGFYQSDVGIFGEYTKFGIFFVIAAITILIKLIIIKVPEDYKFLWYSNLINVLTFFTGDLFSAVDGIVLLCSMLYMYDVSKYKEHILEENTQTDIT